jgi:hypothetical protein
LILQGSYEVQLQAKDDDGNVLFCMLVDFSINGPMFGSIVDSIRENLN